MKINRFDIYGPLGLIQLATSYIKTKIFFPKARLIRFPIVIRGKKYINLGENLTTGIGCRLEAFPLFSKEKLLVFGNNIQINDYVHISAMSKVQIGDNVLMASKIYIADNTHGVYTEGESASSPEISPIDRDYSVAEVIIENNVWIGESVSILPGVTIGSGAIIGSNSVVTKNIPPHSIAVGVPARCIKKYNFKTQNWEYI